MNRTLPPKRGRRRYLEIQYRVRNMIQIREEQERVRRHTAVVIATLMSMIRDHLGLEIPEDEKEYIDVARLENIGYSRGFVEAALKYLSPEFTPEKLYEVIMGGHYWQRGIMEWLHVRRGIVEFVDGERTYDAIGSNYYGFPDNECFYFDPALVVNPKGHNHTGWQKVKKPTVMEVTYSSRSSPPSWWQRLWRTA